MTRLLVYGLLREGQPMNRLMERCELLGVRHVPGHVLHNLGPYPAAVPGEGELVAELYRVPSVETLAAMDQAEGVDWDPPLYQRVEVELDDGPAWLYVYARSTDEAPRIESGDWLDR